MNKDTLYSSPLDGIEAFRFDSNVANVFADMIQRSVPGYQSVLEMTGVYAEQFHQPNTVCYDLGCSLGASTLSILQKIGRDFGNSARPLVVAVDNSHAMLEKCNQTLATHGTDIDQVEFRCEDIRDTQVKDASFVVLNYTLQFIPLKHRLQFLKQIYAGMTEGGALLISEKICFDDAKMDALMIDLHHSFKESQGYSKLEISQKRSAIENVLIPETLNAHITRLKAAGFASISPWFQCLNFCSTLAIK